MVIFHLVGGIGNQMFGYAAGRALAEQRGVPIAYHFDPYPYVHYEYALDVFALTRRFSSSRDLRRLKPKRGIEKRLLRLLGRNPSAHLVTERQEFVFDPAFLSIPDESYVSGFWQTQKYFAPIESVIRRDFQFKVAPDAANAALLDRIENSPSVSIHVRRGDYATVEKINVHGLCSIGYYQEAMARIEAAVAQPVYFFFSDDIGWVKANLTTAHEHYFVDHNTGTRSYEDLRLMSRCRHNIIANSSFSWWGAWLNDHADKIVVAPRQWMTQVSTDNTDILPASWTRV